MKIVIKFLAVIVICSMAGSAHADLMDGLLAHYKFDGNYLDSSGNENHATPHGTSLTSDLNGNANRALRLDGSSHVSLPSVGALNFTVFTLLKADEEFGLGNFRLIDGWSGIELFSIGYDSYMTEVRHGSINEHGFDEAGPYLTGSFHPTGYRNGQYVGYHEEHLNYMVDLEDGNWHAVAISYGSDQVARLFLDGAQVSMFSFVEDGRLSSTNPTKSIDNLVLSLGYSTRNNEYSSGVLDEVRFYDRALSQGEIQSLVAVPLPGAVYFLGAALAGLLGLRRKLSA
jgi:hypothetical protein